MLLICISYVFILSTILRISSAEGRSKAFSTCGAHLTVVILYYGAALSMYLKPSSSGSQERDKIIALLYGVLTPMLNPIIYSLRNIYDLFSWFIIPDELRGKIEIISRVGKDIGKWER